METLGKATLSPSGGLLSPWGPRIGYLLDDGKVAPAGRDLTVRNQLPGPGSGSTGEPSHRGQWCSSATPNLGKCTQFLSHRLQPLSLLPPKTRAAHKPPSNPSSKGGSQQEPAWGPPQENKDRAPDGTCTVVQLLGRRCHPRPDRHRETLVRALFKNKIYGS